jgi:formate/nitrite transporter FocA (FNT family)
MARPEPVTAQSRPRDQPKTGTRFSAEEMHDVVVETADEEMTRPAVELALSGVAAGLGISFSFLAVALLHPHVAPERAALVAGLAYPLGFIYVVLGRHQLFTENTLEPVLPVLERPTTAAFRRLVRLWAIVLPANLVGAALFALVAARTPMLDDWWHGPLIDVARTATDGGAWLVFYRAVFAGWLVALMAWLLAATRETFSQIVLVWLTTAPIAALGFKHSIAGATEAFYRGFVGDTTLAHMMTSFELPALAGNIVGGIVLVALVNHGQAKWGGKADAETAEA